MNEVFNVFGVEIRIENDFYSVRFANTSKGSYVITEGKRKATIKTLEKLIKKLEGGGKRGE